MKKTDLKEKSSVFYVSRTIIMISVIMISAIGFTLGFFVGKNFRPPADMHASGNPPKDTTVQQNSVNTEKEITGQESASLKASKTSLTVKTISIRMESSTFTSTTNLSPSRFAE
jgi:hypothetical protein